MTVGSRIKELREKSVASPRTDWQNGRVCPGHICVASSLAKPI